MPTAATVPAVTNRFFLTDERRNTNSPDIRVRNGTVHKRFIRAAAVETTLPAISKRRVGLFHASCQHPAAGH